MHRERAVALVQDLFGIWYSPLIRYGLRICSDRALVEDVLQETFLLLYRDLCKGNEIANPKAWTLLVMRRQLIRKLRSRTFEVPIDLDLPLAAEEATDTSPPLLADDPILADLSARETEVLLLRLQAMKYREIAQSLKISPNSVNTLLSRALEKIRRRREQPKEPKRANDSRLHDDPDTITTLQ